MDEQVEAFAKVLQTAATALRKMAKYQAFDGNAVALMEAADYADKAAKTLDMKVDPSKLQPLQS